jgi:acetate---CoA ligase (ADP-forming)
VASLPESMPLEMAAQLSAENITPMMGLDDALTAFEAAAFIGKRMNAAPAPLTASRSPPLAGEVPEGPRGGLAPITEYEGKQLLKNFGLTIPVGQICIPTDAVKTAKALGYPVVLKISSTTILHKTEVGGVALNLRNAAEVAVAATRMANLGNELLIEKMVEGAVTELIIGIHNSAWRW